VAAVQQIFDTDFNMSDSGNFWGDTLGPPFLQLCGLLRNCSEASPIDKSCICYWI